MKQVCDFLFLLLINTAILQHIVGCKHSRIRITKAFVFLRLHCILQLTGLLLFTKMYFFFLRLRGFMGPDAAHC